MYFESLIWCLVKGEILSALLFCIFSYFTRDVAYHSSGKAYPRWCMPSGAGTYLDVLSAITVAHRACLLSFKNDLAIIPGNLQLPIHAFRYSTEAMAPKRLFIRAHNM